MGRPYQSELAALPRTYAWARVLPVDQLTTAVRNAARNPLICVGSGGSLTTAHFAAQLHAEETGQIAKVMTPLEVATTRVNLRESGVLLASAGGSNPDILGAFKRVLAREPERLLILCARSESPLSRLASGYEHVHAFNFDVPGGKDGFLATNSLIASVVLLKRAYGADAVPAKDLPAILPDLLPPEHHADSGADDLEARCRPLWARETLVVLHGPDLQPAAFDLESRFTEAALGHVQVADYRNFAHGRHHWIARHGHETAVLSLEGDEDRGLAERTLALLPGDVPVVRLSATGSGTRACLAGILLGLRIAGLAGRARGIDPGSPRVPSFGREIYHLQAFGSSTRRVSSVPSGERSAVERKAGADLPRLVERGELEFWSQAYQAFFRRLKGASFDSLVLDYDGTLCESCEKATGLRPAVAGHLVRLLNAGLRVGIASGRGESVRDDLRKVIPRALWHLLVVGYRNGAEIAPLADDGSPSQEDDVGEELATAIRSIEADGQLRHMVDRTRPRWRQISIYPRPGVHVDALWRRISEIACDMNHPGVKVLQSSHSIDVLAPGISKRAVVAAVRPPATAGAGHPLCIGDRGRWPGNDYELLQAPHSLSVDEVSAAPASCWRLNSPGLKGVQAALQYLAALQARDGMARLNL